MQRPKAKRINDLQEMLSDLTKLVETESVLDSEKNRQKHVATLNSLRKKIENAQAMPNDPTMSDRRAAIQHTKEKNARGDRS